MRYYSEKCHCGGLLPKLTGRPVIQEHLKQFHEKSHMALILTHQGAANDAVQVEIVLTKQESNSCADFLVVSRPNS